MTEEIIRRRSPDISQGSGKEFTPDQLNADLAAASLARDLVNKLPTPAIDTRKFTIIHGLMQSMNHREPIYNPDKTIKDAGNRTYIDTSLLVELMDRVSEKSVNVEGKYFQNLFAYLMKPKYIIQGMPNAATEEQKPSIWSRLFGGFTGKDQSQQAGAPK